MQKEYQGLIFTNHALERVQKRSVSQYDVAQVLKYPDATQETEKPGSTKFIKKINDRNLHVVATYLPEQKQWLIVSVWVRGEEDQPALAWQVITLPFKVLWFVITKTLGLRKKRT
jgi:hypothetical protein